MSVEGSTVQFSDSSEEIASLLLNDAQVRLWFTQLGSSERVFKFAEKVNEEDKKRRMSINQLRTEMRSYLEFSDDWDSEGALPISTSSIKDALTSIGRMPKTVPIPFAEAGTLGEVGVFWEDVGCCKFAEIVWDGDGTMTYIATQRKSNGEILRHGEEGIDVSGPWPSTLLRLLSR